MYISAYIGGKPCGRQVFERNRDLECRIKQAFQVQGGCEMSVESVLSCLDFGPDCRVCQRRTGEFLNKKILAHLGAVYSKFYTLFWPKTLYLHCILQGFYHFSFFGWLFKRTYKYFCAPAPQCFAFVHPRSRRKVPYSAVWILDQIKEYLFYATQRNISLAFIQDVKEGAVVNSILFNVPYCLFIAI